MRNNVRKCPYYMRTQRGSNQLAQLHNLNSFVGHSGDSQKPRACVVGQQRLAQYCADVQVDISFPRVHITKVAFSLFLRDVPSICDFANVSLMHFITG